MLRSFAVIPRDMPTPLGRFKAHSQLWSTFRFLTSLLSFPHSADAPWFFLLCLIYFSGAQRCRQPLPAAILFFPPERQGSHFYVALPRFRTALTVLRFYPLPPQRWGSSRFWFLAPPGDRSLQDCGGRSHPGRSSAVRLPATSASRPRPLDPIVDIVSVINNNNKE